MTRCLLLAALLPFAIAAQPPPVRVTTLPAVPSWQPAGELPTGTVFQASEGGGPCMVVSPLHDPEPPYVYYGARQFPRPADWFPSGRSYYDPPLTMSVALAVGTLAVAALADLPPDVWCVDLGDGVVFKLPATSEVRPVARVRVTVQVGPANPAPEPPPEP